MSMGRHNSVAALAMITAALSVPAGVGPTAPIEQVIMGGNQPHGHSSSQGSTSNTRSSIEKKRRRKLAAKSKRRNRR